MIYRLLADPPKHILERPDSLYGTPKKGGLVFSVREDRSTGERFYTASPGGWGVSFKMPEDQVEIYRDFAQPRHEDFMDLLKYYAHGKAFFPNLEEVPVNSGLDMIASGAGLRAYGDVHNVLLPGETYSSWCRIFIGFTQGGRFDGRGLIIWYRGGLHRGARFDSQILKFALCQHEKRVGSRANPSRGWHPGSCTKCGLDMTVDSSD